MQNKHITAHMSIEPSGMNKAEIIFALVLLLGLGASTVLLILSFSNFDILIRNYGYFFVFLISTGLVLILNGIMKELYNRSLMETIHVLFLKETPILIPVCCVVLSGLLFYTFMALPRGSLEEINGLYYLHIHGYQEEISYAEYREGAISVWLFFFNLCSLLYLYALGMYWKKIFGKSK